MTNLSRCGLICWTLSGLAVGQVVSTDTQSKPYEILNDTLGVDVGPYLGRALKRVQENWYRYVPESAHLPQMKSGKVSIVFHILKKGDVTDLRVDASSGDVQLDDAALSAVMASKPFAPLPEAYSQSYLALRFNFVYNPGKGGSSVGNEIVSSKPSLPSHQLELGTVEGRTYRNPAIRLEFTPAPNLKLATPELKTGPDGKPTLVTISAWDGESVVSSREGIVFYAEALSPYAIAQRSTQAYMVKVAARHGKDGFALIDSRAQSNLGGVSFERADFQKGAIYEAVLVKACEEQALVFVFTGPARTAVDILIAGTQLTVELPQPSCHSKADDSAPGK